MSPSKPRPGFFPIALLLAGLALLEPLTGDGSRVAVAVGEGPLTAGEAEVVAGLRALAQEQPEAARETLLDAQRKAGRFEDWRLLGLAEAAAALRQLPPALAALDELLDIHHGSPLRRRAAIRAAELTAELGEPQHALDSIERALATVPEAETAANLAALAWEVADRLESRPPRQSAARRLLVDYPLRASELQVIDLFRDPEGGLEWAAFLSAAELERRAAQLLRVGLPRNAIETLQQIRETDRTLESELLLAESLTADHRGVEALRRLERVEPPSPAAGQRVDWLSARAALDAASVRRGRRNLGTADRQEMARRVRLHLARAADLQPPTELSVRALELLAAETSDDGDVEATTEALRRLLTIDPGNRSGAAHLWRLGWKQFVAGNDADAIAIWSRLAELYPLSDAARGGLYWSAQAHQRLGNPDRAVDLLRRIAAADVDDFYRRHAVRKLGSGGETPSPPQPEAWPSDPTLERPVLLSDLGLHHAALLDLDGRLSIDPRAGLALRARILARLGRPRESIQVVRRAFPDLGTARQWVAPAEALRLYYPLAYDDVVRAHAGEYGLSPYLVLAMIRQESAFDAGATSSAGARGLMQLMPATGRELAARIGLIYRPDLLSDPGFSVRLGTAYFRQVLEMFDRTEELALAGYNAGPYRIRRLWSRAGGEAEIDRFLEGLQLPETRSYVKRVVLFADSYRRLYG